MRGEALYVTLRVPDPAALTAAAALARLGSPAPAWLERGRVWHHSGVGWAFAEPAGVWLNPNKERGVRWAGGGEPWTASRARAGESEIWVLVRDRGSRPEAGVIRSLNERGEPAPEALVCAGLWRMGFAGGTEAALGWGRAAGEVRSAHCGLLVNPHSQAHRVCAPATGLDELGRLLEQLKREAT